MDLDQETADKYLTSVMSDYGGMTKALKPIKDTRVQIKGMSKDYDNLTKFLDLSNYAG
ncbi:TPA: hypothetical protein KRK47_002556 [Clostridioides difficile]|nr:hypothetical protein [Clostridioides difficile]